MSTVLEKKENKSELTEKTELINSVIDKIAEFVVNDAETKEDYIEYLNTIGGNSIVTTVTYIFERHLNSKSILEIYLKKNKDIDKEEKSIIKALSDSVSSVFEVKKIAKNRFELFNLFDEQMYSILSPVKMTAFRGLGVGYYVALRFFNFEKENYLIELIGAYPSTKKSLAYKYAISKIMSNPSLVYKNNKNMKKKLSEKVKNTYDRFNEIFNTDEITTSNKYADDLIEYFNSSDKEFDWQSKIEDIDVKKYFDVSSMSNSGILENAGFSKQKKSFDVTLLVDENWGFYAIPFYKTFCDFLNGKSIENSGKMIDYFLTTPAVTRNILERIMNKYPNFMEVINKEKKSNMTFEEMLDEYKGEQTYSLTTILEESSVFSKVLDIIEDEENIVHYQKVGRNDLCPCGSGKKYKKCCMLKANN